MIIFIITVTYLYPSTLIIPDRAPIIRAPTGSHIIPACIEKIQIRKNPFAY